MLALARLAPGHRDSVPHRPGGTNEVAVRRDEHRISRLDAFVRGEVDSVAPTQAVPRGELCSPFSEGLIELDGLHLREERPHESECSLHASGAESALLRRASKGSVRLGHEEPG